MRVGDYRNARASPSTRATSFVTMNSDFMVRRNDRQNARTIPRSAATATKNLCGATTATLVELRVVKNSWGHNVSTNEVFPLPIW